MPASVAGRADFGLAARTLAVFAAAVRAVRRISVNVRGLDPFATAFGWAVEPVRSGVFLVLLVPLHLELKVEELVDVLQGNVFGSAAGRRHVRRIGDRHGKDAAEAGVAHTVTAGEFGGFGDRNVIRHASKAFDSICVLAREGVPVNEYSLERGTKIKPTVLLALYTSVPRISNREY